MTAIRSPLGALGALMVFLQGIAAAALVPLEDQPGLRVALVSMMIVATSAITVVVLYVVVRFAHTNPGLLFPIGDFDPNVQKALLGIPIFSSDEIPEPDELAELVGEDLPIFWAEVESDEQDK